MNQLLEIVTSDMLPDYSILEPCSKFNPSLADYYVAIPKGKEDILLDKLNVKNKVLRQDIKSKLGTEDVNEKILRVIRKDSPNKYDDVHGLTEYMATKYGSEDNMLKAFNLLSETDLGLTDEFINDITQSQTYNFENTPVFDKDEEVEEEKPKHTTKQRTRKLNLAEPNFVEEDREEEVKEDKIKNIEHEESVSSLHEDDEEKYNNNESNSSKEIVDETNLLKGYMLALCDKLNIDFDEITQIAMKKKEMFDNPELTRNEVVEILDVFLDEGRIDSNYYDMVLYCFDSGKEDFAEREIGKLVDEYNKEHEGV